MEQHASIDKTNFSILSQLRVPFNGIVTFKNFIINYISTCQSTEFHFDFEINQSQTSALISSYTLILEAKNRKLIIALPIPTALVL